MFTKGHRLVSGDFFVENYYLLQCEHHALVSSDVEVADASPHLQSVHVQALLSQQLHPSTHLQSIHVQIVHQH